MFVKVKDGGVGATLTRLPRVFENISGFDKADKAMQVAKGFYELIEVGYPTEFQYIDKENIVDVVDDAAGTVTRTYPLLEKPIEDYQLKQVQLIDKIVKGKILNISSDYQQRNDLQRNMEFMEIVLGDGQVVGRSLTAPESTERDAIRSRWSKVAALRLIASQQETIINNKTTHQGVKNVSPKSLWPEDYPDPVEI